MNKLTISLAIEGYLLAAQTRRLSYHTILDYKATFRKFREFLVQDIPVDEITVRHVEAFLASQQEISKKTLLNYHIGLSALWTWCVEEELVKEHILHRVKRPKPERKDVQPYSQTEVKEMLDSLTHSRSYSRPNKVEYRHSQRSLSP